MGIFIVLGIALVFATGAVTIWDGVERIVQLIIERVRARIMLKNGAMLEEQASSEWYERKKWHEEIDGIYKERERKLLNEKF